MSNYDRLIRQSDKQTTLDRAHARQAKQRALFECEALDADLFEYDAPEIDDMNERLVSYAQAH